MINYDYNMFVNYIYYGEELNFSYKDRKYFIQGWGKEDDNKKVIYHLELIRWVPLLESKLWEFNSEISMAECAKKFLKTPIFDKKTFSDIESEVETIDFPKDSVQETKEYWEKHPEEIPDGII